MLEWLTFAGEAGGATQPAAGASGGLFTMLLPLALVFFVMYWLMIRPQKKAEEKRHEMIKAIAKGDKVVSIGGIYGQVTDIDDKSVTLKVDQSKGVEIRFLKEAIRGVERSKKSDDASATPSA